MRGYIAILIFVLLVIPANAFFLVEPGYQAEAEYHSPIIFIPGVMGSILEDDNRYTTSDELWPGNPQEGRNELAFLDDGKSPEIEGSKIKATAVLRKTWGSDIYQPFYAQMDKTIYKFNGQYGETSYLRQAYFDHAYDFRRSTEYQIPLLDAKVKDVLKNTHSKKVILVAHSMGSLQAKMYATQNPDKIRAVILLSGPLNGAPRGFESLTEGYNFGAGPLISIPHVWEIGHNWPGIFHLSPNHPFATMNGQSMSLDDTFLKGINYQRAQHIPGPVFADLHARGIHDPAAVTKELESKYTGLSKDIYKETVNFRKKFDTFQTDPSIRVEIIHGDGQLTTQSFTVTDELYTSPNTYPTGERVRVGMQMMDVTLPFKFSVRRFTQVNSKEGDETVHKKGFEWASAKKSETVNAGHMVMAGTPETASKMMAIVEEINHDTRDKQWVEKIKWTADSNLAGVKMRAASAESQSQEYGEAYKEEMKKENKDTGFINKMLGDIGGRGKYAFLDNMIVGNKNRIQIVVPDLGDYDGKNKEFKAWVMLDSYNVVDANIGSVSPADYVVSMDKDTFLALMNNQMNLKQAWTSGAITISGGFRERLMGWVASWVTKYTKGD